MKDDLISVIIPLYNDRKYIKKCLKSIIRQTYQNLEIIVINDGSTDDSLNICRKMQKKDKRIIIKSQKNSGCAVARNKALKIARGKYIVFVDSDDYVKRNMIRELHDNMLKNDLQLLMFEGKVVYTGINPKNAVIQNNRYIKKHDYIEIQKGIDLFKKMRHNAEFSSVIWIMMYKREVLDKYKIKFTPKILHDDMLFTFKCLVLANRVKFIHKKYYIRRARKGSLTTRKHDMNDSYSCYMLANLLEDFCKKYKIDYQNNEINTFINDVRNLSINDVLI